MRKRPNDTPRGTNTGPEASTGMGIAALIAIGAVALGVSAIKAPTGGDSAPKHARQMFVMAPDPELGDGVSNLGLSSAVRVLSLPAVNVWRGNYGHCAVVIRDSLAEVDSHGLVNPTVRSARLDGAQKEVSLLLSGLELKPTFDHCTVEQ